MALQHLRSSTANKRPDPTAMADGQIALNTAAASPGLFYKDGAGNLVKVGPVHVGTTAPNASPASGGTAGNSVGEQWLDITGGTYVFKVWDGSAWRSETGTFVDVNGDVMTGALGIIAGTAAAPGLYISGDTNTGIYSPGANQLALSTDGTGRLFVDASGNVGVGAAPVVAFNGQTHLTVNHSTGGTTVAGISLATDGARRASFITYPSNSEALRITAESATLPITVYTNSSERLRSDSSGRLLVGTSNDSGGALFQVNGNRIRVGTAKTPASATDTGTAGEICWDANYIYVCTATNTWKRTAIATW